MADDDKGESSIPKQLPNPDPGDDDLRWLKTLSQQDQLTYYQERLAWQQAKVKFESAEAAAAGVRDQPVAALEALKTKYNGALELWKAAKKEAETLKGKIDKAQAAVKADEADDAQKTSDSLNALQAAIKDYGTKAAEAAKAKAALDEAQAALTAASDSATRRNFDPSKVKDAKPDEKVQAAAKRDYDFAVEAAAEEMEAAKQKFIAKQTQLNPKTPSPEPEEKGSS